MYKKCEVFGDLDSVKKILATEDTKLQQTIGRNASGYVSNMWAGMRQVIVLRGLFAKFSWSALGQIRCGRAADGLTMTDGLMLPSGMGKTSSASL